MGIRRRYQEMGYQERGTYQRRGMTVLREGYQERGIGEGYQIHQERPKGVSLEGYQGRNMTESREVS